MNSYDSDGWAVCGPDCPMHPNAWRTDDILRVTHHYDQKEITTAWKLFGILSASLLLIAMMVVSLGAGSSNKIECGILAISQLKLKQTYMFQWSKYSSGWAALDFI